MACTLSVIIPSRNEYKNLLWTIQALQIELQGIDYEIIALLHETPEIDRLRKYHPAKSGVLKVIDYDKPSCWQARNYGASIASGDYLLFLDSHVIFEQGALRQALEYHKEFQGILHFGLRYWLDKPTLYQYKWNGDKFWGSWTRKVPQEPDYRILMSGIFAALVDSNVFHGISGFHPSLGIYGGGEPYIDLKTQMYGYEVRCNPQFVAYHLAEKRGYSWNNDDLWRNFMISAFSLGGEKYLKPLYEHYLDRCNGHQPYIDKLNELRTEAIELADNDRLKIEREAVKTLDEVLGEHYGGPI